MFLHHQAPQYPRFCNFWAWSVFGWSNSKTQNLKQGKQSKTQTLLPSTRINSRKKAIISMEAFIILSCFQMDQIPETLFFFSYKWSISDPRQSHPTKQWNSLINHRIIKRFGGERTLKIISFQPFDMGWDTFC